MTKTVALVQARMGSSRLPGKVLLDVGGRPLLEWVLLRLARANRVDRIIVVTTITPSDDVLCQWLSRNGWAFYRGAELDLLDRYYQAAFAVGAKNVVRITSDCPLIDAELVNEVIESREANQADYASNFVQKHLPLGLSAEVCTFSALRQAWAESTESYERTHVTPYLYLHPDRFRIQSVVGAGEDLSGLRWTVDMPQDIEMMRALYADLGERLLEMNWHQVLGVIREKPHISKINEAVRQKTLQEL